MVKKKCINIFLAFVVLVILFRTLKPQEKFYYSPTESINASHPDTILQWVNRRISFLNYCTEAGTCRAAAAKGGGLEMFNNIKYLIENFGSPNRDTARFRDFCNIYSKTKVWIRYKIDVLSNGLLKTRFKNTKILLENLHQTYPC
jgi:hypothetical protein